MGWVAPVLQYGSLALGALSAANQAKSGNQQADSLNYQGEFNAGIYEQQAQMVLEKKKLQDYQFNRALVRSRGAVVSRTAGAGFQFSGSPVAIAVDNETQMLLDKAVGDFNLDIERNFYLSGATASRYQASEQAKLSKSTGNTNAFSTLLSSVSSFGQRNIPTGQKAGKL